MCVDVLYTVYDIVYFKVHVIYKSWRFRSCCSHEIYMTLLCGTWLCRSCRLLTIPSMLQKYVGVSIINRKSKGICVDIRYLRNRTITNVCRNNQSCVVGRQASWLPQSRISFRSNVWFICYRILSNKMWYSLKPNVKRCKREEKTSVFLRTL